MSRKACLSCRGRGYTHYYPCYWDPLSPPDNIFHNPPPPCRCRTPRCTDCEGSGERTAAKGDSWVVVLVAGRVTDGRYSVRVQDNNWTVEVEGVGTSAVLMRFTAADAPVLDAGTRLNLHRDRVWLGQVVVVLN